MDQLKKELELNTKDELLKKIEKEQKKIELLGKLITEKNIPTELRLRKQAYNFETIPLKKEEDRIVIREAKEVEGWEFDKDFKNSIKIIVNPFFGIVINIKTNCILVHKHLIGISFKSNSLVNINVFNCAP